MSKIKLSIGGARRPVIKKPVKQDPPQERDQKYEEQSSGPLADKLVVRQELPGSGVVLASTSQRHQAPEWDGRKVMVGFPCYKYTNPATAWTLVAFALDLGKEKIRFEVELGDAVISNARNRLAQKFMASECEWLQFIDDDMISPIGRPGFMRQMCRLPETHPDEPLNLHTIHRLHGHQKSIVGATYYTRNPQGLPVNALARDREYLARAANFSDSVMECEWVGTGCMMIHRSVFVSLMEKFPELAPVDDESPWRFFQYSENGSGEDVSFCRRASQAGHQAFVDTMLQCQHVGYACYGAQSSQSLQGER